MCTYSFTEGFVGSENGNFFYRQNAPCGGIKNDDDIRVMKNQKNWGLVIMSLVLWIF